MESPNQVWVGDITYIWTLTGWGYLATVMDLFSRRIIGWALEESMEEQLVIDALQMAIGRRQPAQGLLFHSDQGAQYTGEDYQKLMKEAQITASLSRKGNCWDNAVAERFFPSLKVERVYRTIYRNVQEAKVDIIEYIEMFYNAKRLHSYLGYLSPIEFEQQRDLS